MQKTAAGDACSRYLFPSAGLEDLAAGAFGEAVDHLSDGGRVFLHVIRILDAGDMFDAVRVGVNISAIVVDALVTSGADGPNAIFFGHRPDGEALLFEVLPNTGGVFPGLLNLKARVAGDEDEGVGREGARAVEGETGLTEIVLGKIVCRHLEYAAPVLIEEPGATVVGECVFDWVEAAGAGTDGGLRERIELADPGRVRAHPGKGRFEPGDHGVLPTGRNQRKGCKNWDGFMYRYHVYG